MDQLHWKLRDFLQARHIPTLKLEEKADVSRVTLYRLTSPNPKKQQNRIDFPTLTAIIAALRDLTGEDVTPNDLLEFVPAPQPQQADEDDPALWLATGARTLEQAEPYDWDDGEADEGAPLAFEEGKGWASSV